MNIYSPGPRIRNLVFIAGVNDTGDKLFTGVNNISDKLLTVSLLPAINFAAVVDNRGLHVVPDFYRFHETDDLLIAGNNNTSYETVALATISACLNLKAYSK
jgi:hypothetical protein